MKLSTTDNRPYLLMPGTDQPECDGDGKPIPNPNFGQVTVSGEDDPPPPAVARVFSATAFMDHCYANLGGSFVGMARFAEVIRLARAAAANSDLIGAVVERYDCAKSGGTFAKSQVADFADLLTKAGIMKDGERSAILDNWPTD